MGIARISKACRITQTNTMKTTPVSNFALFLSCSLSGLGCITSAIAYWSEEGSLWMLPTMFFGLGFTVLLLAVIKKGF